jgi:glutamate racemase
MGDDVVLIDSGKETALEIKKALDTLGLAKDSTVCGKADFYVTNNTEAFDAVAKIFLGENANIKSVLKDIKE